MYRLFLFLILALVLGAAVEDLFYEPDQNIVLSTKRIVLDRFEGAFNPSIAKVAEGFLLTFRYCPDPANQNWLSYTGVVILNESLDLVTEPQLLNTREKNSKTPSQVEDARLFIYKDKLFLIYNDNIDEIFFGPWTRRDMFMAQLFVEDGHYQLSRPVKLVCEEKIHSQSQQKNWVPFEWNQTLLFGYSVTPHEILVPNLKNGACFSKYKTDSPIDWIYGKLRGSSAALLVDGEYLAFFHSGVKTRSPASHDWKLWHYFMGAYTFSATPPFQILKMTEKPILGKDFYTPSYREKRVVFPGGFVDAGETLYLAYGKDDCEIWVAILDKKELKRALIPRVIQK